ncbi:unnamed protein product [Cochlearia groenlandica]
MGSCVSSFNNNNNVNKRRSSSASGKLPGSTIAATSLFTTIIDSDHHRYSSEEIVYFDSRGWLDSDCEDDFMSVNGEFTPSGGTTPVHHKFIDQTPKSEEELSHLTDDNNKKRLVELFKETQEDDHDDDVAEYKARACLWLRTPVRSSAPATPYNINKQQLKRVRSAAGHGGCVPRLVSCSSFTERRPEMMPTQ